ncbi:hypothetical protein [Streptomyces sp. NPDC017993]|uniref:hypothetical protein n=1 Tax=Streptomyces sp. NPDC017993 TaxID=3365027 RepID=UPI003790DCF1
MAVRPDPDLAAPATGDMSVRWLVDVVLVHDDAHTVLAGLHIAGIFLCSAR